VRAPGQLRSRSPRRAAARRPGVPCHTRPPRAPPPPAPVPRGAVRWRLPRAQPGARPCRRPPRPPAPRRPLCAPAPRKCVSIWRAAQAARRRAPALARKQRLAELRVALERGRHCLAVVGVGLQGLAHPPARAPRLRPSAARAGTFQRCLGRQPCGRSPAIGPRGGVLCRIHHTDVQCIQGQRSELAPTGQSHQSRCAAPACCHARHSNIA